MYASRAVRRLGVAHCDGHLGVLRLGRCDCIHGFSRNTGDQAFGRGHGKFKVIAMIILMKISVVRVYNELLLKIDRGG